MSLRKFNVKVNGKSYIVEVEELSPAATASGLGNDQPAAAPAVAETVNQNTTPPGVTAPPAGSTRTPVAGKEVVVAPLPGKITALQVTAGQKVQAGDLICVLEAMKMENELFCSVTGTVKEVLVRTGDTVAVGEALVVID